MAAQITALTGTPPSRSDPVNFSARADAFLGQLPDFQSQANALATEAEANALLAETKRDEASTFASNALSSANAAAASFDSFDDRYLGPKASAPTLDNDGQTLLVGALYFDTTLNRMRVRNNANTAWIDAYYTDENLTVTNLTVSGDLSLPDGSVTLGTETQGNYVATVAAGTSGTQTGASGLSITGTGEGASVTIAHADTSSQASVNNSGNTVIQDIVLDTYGHITALVSTTIDSVGSVSVTATNASDTFPLVFANTSGSGTKSLVMNGSASAIPNSPGTYNGPSNTATINIQGNAQTATALLTGRTFSVSGDLTGTSPSFDGTGNLSIPCTLVDAKKSLGDGQTWQNLTGSRALGTTYTNTTGRSILISVYGVKSSSALTTITVDSNVVLSTGVESSASSDTIQMLIPNGSTYSVTFGGGSLTTWFELR